MEATIGEARCMVEGVGAVTGAKRRELEVLAAGASMNDTSDGALAAHRRVMRM